MAALVNPFTLPSFSKEKYLYMMEFDVERWYPLIQKYTFETHFAPITPSQAEAMTKYYKANHVHKTFELPKFMMDQLDKEVKPKLKTLMGSFKNAVSYFVRISSRSPKDAGLDGANSELKHLVEEEIVSFKQAGFSIDTNMKLQALFNAVARFMQVETPEDAMGLLLDSERIYTDLLRALEQDHSLWNMNLIVREYMAFDVSMEFRGFVCKKVLTALSQYNDMCYYTTLKSKEQWIVDKIFNFFLTVRDLIPYDAYIIDFVIMENSVRIIELNPFGKYTGASLFNWDVDRYLLQGGQDLYGDLKVELTPEITQKPLREPCYHEFTSTQCFDNGWKTVFRSNKRMPERVNSDYVNTLYGDLIKSNAIQKLFKADAAACIIS